MAKKYRDVLSMQFNMLLEAKQYNESHSTNPNTRRASGETVVNPKTNIKYRVVG